MGRKNKVQYALCKAGQVSIAHLQKELKKSWNVFLKNVCLLVASVCKGIYLFKTGCTPSFSSEVPNEAYNTIAVQILLLSFEESVQAV